MNSTVINLFLSGLTVMNSNKPLPVRSDCNEQYSNKPLPVRSGCVNSMNHLKEEVDHEAKHRCRYTAQYDNRIYTCKACYEGGKEVIVIPKTTASSDSPWFGLATYAWSGYVIECPNCGVIYRSRQYWYGNQDPVDTVVRTEIQHIWPGVRTTEGSPTYAWARIHAASQSTSVVLWAGPCPFNHWI
nr:zinc finger FYVE domain-containing protein 1-like isoform X2 [Oncorhynchus nerka]